MHLDHFLLGIRDLDQGIEQFEALSGVRPAYGGKHPGLGTHNALVSLGNQAYLEIIAPQEKGQALSGPFKGFEKFETLSPVGWVLATQSLEKVASALDKFKLPHGGIQAGSRQTSAGEMLNWRTIFLGSAQGIGLNPFFIEWDAQSPHPSTRNPAGCSLERFSIQESPDSDLSAFLKDLDLEMDKMPGEEAGTLCQIQLNSPKGLLSF